MSPAPVTSSPLLTDLYELTMAYGYWKAGIDTHEACFHHSYRHNPFGGGYALACGLAELIDFLQEFRFAPDDLAYFEGLRGPGGRPLFEPAFLDHLGALRFACDLDAVPEGTVVFPREPLVRVCGPLLQAQLIETALLTIVNFQTLIATKAARVCHAAQGDPVLEFGLRRAQGVNGGLAASRAAYVGGCAATSNVLAGKLHDIPVRGTHAHSWVMAFDRQADAFAAYVSALPHAAILLVDTYDTLEGVRDALRVGRELRERGHDLLGIRLDSGDLLRLSRSARRLLDEAGFERTRIVASGDLDEHRIAELKERGAPIDVWGVGTRLATAFDEPALSGVYKLTALREPGGAWRYRIKRSDDPEKRTDPGILQVRRLGGERFVEDRIYDLTLGIEEPGEDLLVPLLRGGREVGPVFSVHEARQRAQAQLAALPPEVRGLRSPARYPVRLEPRLAALKAKLMEEDAK